MSPNTPRSSKLFERRKLRKSNEDVGKKTEENNQDPSYLSLNSGGLSVNSDKNTYSSTREEK